MNANNTNPDRITLGNGAMREIPFNATPTPAPRLTMGGRVRVVRGDWRGLEGTLVAIGPATEEDTPGAPFYCVIQAAGGGLAVAMSFNVAAAE